MNEKYHDAEEYSKKLEGIARATNWYESKTKSDKINQNKLLQQKIDSELNHTQSELKMARTIRLK